MRAIFIDDNGAPRPLPEKGEYVEAKVNGIREPVVAMVMAVDLKNIVVALSVYPRQPSGLEVDHFNRRKMAPGGDVTLTPSAKIFVAMDKRRARRQ